MRSILTFSLTFLSLWVYAQQPAAPAAPPVIDTFYSYEYLDKSTRFAWTTLGGDVLALTGGNTDYLVSKALQNTDFGPTFIPRLSIGGIHFWGHTDFYVTFPLGFLAVSDKPAAFEKMKFLHGIETGAKLYPFAIRPGKLRPFTGISFRSESFGFEQPEDNFREGYPVRQRYVAPVQAGLTYAGKKYLFSLGAHYIFNREADYFLGENTIGQVDFNPLSFNLSVHRYFDADARAREPRGISQENIMHYLLKENGKMSSFYWGIGPSAGLQLSKSDFFKNRFPQFYDQLTGGFIPDITFGYHFHQPDLNAGLSYRTMGTRLRAIEDDLRLRRHSFMLEGYKFLFNYLGFVPFAGITVSGEYLSANVNGTTTSAFRPALGFIAGWDIRVTRTGTSLLRTNLRWIPNLHLKVEGEKLMFNHLEFNFIQYVHFIGRNRFYQKYRKQKTD